MRRLTAFLIIVRAGAASAADPHQAAQRLDDRLHARFVEEQITPEPRADDAEFYRQLSLDLIGRIPTSAEAREFIDSTSDRKRDEAIDRLLASPEHADHFANVWRSLLIPEADADRQLRFFLPGFEAWLNNRRNENARFDVVVRELLAVPIIGAAARPQPVLTDMRAPNPIAFIAAKESSPSKLAAAATRLFLGVRLECAECHNHPFDSWTQQQFWNQAAFFAGVERKGRGPFALVFEKPETRSIAMMSDESKVVSVKYLTGAEPTFDDGANPRAKLAEWITSRDNELFARAIANRVWGQFLGRGIVDPVDDFSDANPPSHPELLTDLAAEFTASGYDLTHLYRVVCRTAAFQRTSKSSSLAPSDPQAFARMAVKPMSGEQFYDSLPQAIALEQLPPSKAMTRNEEARLSLIESAYKAKRRPRHR